MAATVRAELIEQRAGDDAALELALSMALLQRVATGERPPTVRCYRPRPTVAFSRRDRLLPGFPRAVEVARRHGFVPALRSAGGRVAAYHEGCLVLDEIVGSSDAMSAIRERFSDCADAHARALRSLGVDARVGEVAGEYCPGEFSVNARGAVKLIGSAQRVIRGAWLLAAVVVVADAASLLPVLVDVHAALGVEWDPATTGAVADEVPGVTIAGARHALLAEYERRYRLFPAVLRGDDLAAAREQLERHRADP